MKKFAKKLLSVSGFVSLVMFAACFDSSSFLTVNSRQCTACARCEKVCPVDAIQIIDAKAVIDPTECIECGKCVDECPEDAIQ